MFRVAIGRYGVTGGVARAWPGSGVIEHVETVFRLLIVAVSLDQGRICIKRVGPELILLPDTIKSAVVEDAIPGAYRHLAVAEGIIRQRRSAGPSSCWSRRFTRLPNGEQAAAVEIAWAAEQAAPVGKIRPLAYVR